MTEARGEGFTEGGWTYSPTDWAWKATNGHLVLTAGTVTDLRRKVYEACRSGNPQITVISGPGRALSARRFTSRFTD